MAVFGGIRVNTSGYNGIRPNTAVRYIQIHQIQRNTSKRGALLKTVCMPRMCSRYAEYAWIHTQYNQIQSCGIHRNTRKRTPKYTIGIQWIQWIQHDTMQIRRDTNPSSTSKYSETHSSTQVRDTEDTKKPLLYNWNTVKYTYTNYVGIQRNALSNTCPRYGAYSPIPVMRIQIHPQYQVRAEAHQHDGDTPNTTLIHQLLAKYTGYTTNCDRYRNPRKYTHTSLHLPRG